MPPGWQIIPDNLLIVRNRSETRHGDFSGLVRAVEGGCLPVSRLAPKLVFSSAL